MDKTSKKKKKVSKYVFQKLMKQLFKIRKKNEIPEGWNKLMLSVVNTIRSVSLKYSENVKELQKMTYNFPKTLARIGSGINEDKIKIFKDNICNISCEWYIPVKLFNINIKDKSFKNTLFLHKPEIILYLHGGAMCLCSHKSHREMLLRLSLSANSVILAINYRKPPEHPFPAPQDDCYNIYLWLINNGFNVSIAGDSAGGNLALHTTKLLRDNNKKMPSKLILISPWTNLVENSENSESSLIKNSNIDFLTLNGIKIFANHCIEQNKNLTKEEIEKTLKKYSPNYFNLENFPKIYMFTGDKEMLIDQQRYFVDLAKKYNLKINYIEEKNMIHVYPLFAGFGIEASKNFFRYIENIF